ncbi:unnamed protein product [Dibothriocephalus latus]|uniref:Uncharacterized protein n=1 Tax=Dibothriocephalus latus TaxID=60516 RepID=A0A3P7NZE5_DIBLA|nr:unnamed protein product [Dibothriocephalus latus]
MEKSGLVAEDARSNSFDSPVLLGADADYNDPAAAVTGHQRATSSFDVSSNSQTFLSGTDSGADSEGDSSSQSGVCYADTTKYHKSFLTGMEENEDRGLAGVYQNGLFKQIFEFYLEKQAGMHTMWLLAGSNIHVLFHADFSEMNPLENAVDSWV